MITMKPPIVVRDLAERLQKKPFQLIADLMALNVFANVNQAIDELVAQKICAKYGYRFEVEKRERGAGQVHAPVRKVEPDIIEDKPEDLKPRPPVVTIMGHVDHGKTTLLDVIRKADVASGEAGGITQHIGAYTISIPHPERPNDLQQITFLDTPGHAAFSAMRARGANVTDIVILVVAANDGVMPQTVEALNHAKAAKVPIIVAVNKIDHPNANPAKARQQLQEQGIVPEEWGGETIFQDVSALTKLNIDKLLELIVLQAEVMELKANPNRTAKGNVIESGLEPGGPTATVLVRKGTLRVGDVLLCGPYYGKVRALINEENQRLKEAGPSVAVKMLGLNGVPEAGVEFTVVENEKTARNIAGERALALKSEEFEKRPKVTLENLFDTLASEQNKTLKVIVKADTQGSVEAIVDALKKIETNKVALDIIHSAVGTITESDVILASASERGAIVLGFHTRIDNGVSDVAKREGVQIKLYAIIYELIDQVKEAMAGLLDPLTKEVVIGSAEVRKIFGLSKGGNVAGCVVSSGRIVKGKMRVMRRKGLIYEGVSLTLRRFQDEVNEVRAGMECGIRLDGFDDYQLGDAIECYTVEKVPQKL
jgi:translation initiation factor IF-2